MSRKTKKGQAVLDKYGWADTRLPRPDEVPHLKLTAEQIAKIARQMRALAVE